MRYLGEKRKLKKEQARGRERVKYKIGEKAREGEELERDRVQANDES